MSRLKSKLQFWGYRLATIIQSFKTLYTLPPEKLNAFLDSYEIYDHDWVNEDQLIEKMGPDYYNKVQQKLIDYYSILNHLCALGQVEKMYIPPAMDLSKSIIDNQLLFEEKLGRDLGVKKGDHVLDIGCGRGRVASNIASATGANITGMNIDHDQLNSATLFAKSHGLGEQCQFRWGDLNEIPYPFADNSLDGIYHVQVFSLCKNLEKLFAELYRILKPQAKFVCIDWIRLDKYDPNDVRHTELMKRVKPLIGAIGTPSEQEYTSPIQKAGFNLLTSENISVDGLQAPLIENADKYFTRVHRFIRFLVRCRVLPQHFNPLFDRLTKDGQAFIQADRERLVTTSHYIIAQKP